MVLSFDVNHSRLTISYLGTLLPRKGDIDVNTAYRIGSRVRATIRDVAALAGVGTKTVSRVINDEANVSPQTRERVQRAVLALNFKPNQGAGALRRGDRKTLTLGLLLDAVDNPFSAAINRAVETVAYGRDTAVLAASSDNDPRRERVDGRCLHPSSGRWTDLEHDH